MTEFGFIPTRIDGPPPEAPLYGLLSAAAAPAAGVRFITDTTFGIDRWMNGAEVFPYPIDVGDVYDPCAVGFSPPQQKGDGTVAEIPRFHAMTVFVPEICTTYKVWDHDAFKARVLATLTATESAIVAKEFLGGARMPSQPFLSDGDAGCLFPNGDTATSVPDALGYLEQQIALTGRQGLIHCSPQLVTAFRERFAVDNKTGVIRTINGTVVIADFGYAAGASPLGHASAVGTQEWVYATGPIDIRRSEIFVMPEQKSQAVDRGTGGATNGKPNSVTYRAERYYLVTWDEALQVAVLSDRCLTTCVSNAS